MCHFLVQSFMGGWSSLVSGGVFFLVNLRYCIALALCLLWPFHQHTCTQTQTLLYSCSSNVNEVQVETCPKSSFSPHFGLGLSSTVTLALHISTQNHQQIMTKLFVMFCSFSLSAAGLLHHFMCVLGNFYE